MGTRFQGFVRQSRHGRGVRLESDGVRWGGTGKIMKVWDETSWIEQEQEVIGRNGTY